MDEEFSHQLEEFKKCHNKLIIETIHLQPLRDKIVKISLQDPTHHGCLLHFWLDGVENQLEYSFPDDQVLVEKLHKVFAETEFPTHQVPLIEQLEFIWSTFHTVYKETYQNNANSSPNHPNKNDKKSKKKSSMKTARDVIKRIKWDSIVDGNLVVVGYTDRFIGIVESEFNRFDWDSNLASIGPQTLAIPEHRIEYFKYNEEIIWKKSTRYDAVFGSSGTDCTLIDVVNRHQQQGDDHGHHQGGDHLCAYENTEQDEKEEEDEKINCEPSTSQQEVAVVEKTKEKLNKDDVRVSKALSAVLRHNRMGFHVDDKGYIKVDEILKHPHFKYKLKATREIIHKVVNNNDKQRFQLHADDSGVELIRAVQGHSVEVRDLELKEIDKAEDFPTVIHGTYKKFWNDISFQGLHRKNRNHIHMTTGRPRSGDVISGMRSTCDVFIYINIEAAMKDGIKFYLSENRVILSPGNKRGFILPKYFKHVDHK